MVRRSHCFPGVMAEEDWNKLPMKPLVPKEPLPCCGAQIMAWIPDKGYYMCPCGKSKANLDGRLIRERGGLKKVLIPQDNAKDLADIPANVKNALEIVPVSRMDEVLKHALVRLPTPIVWEEEAPVKGAAAALPDEDQSGVVAH
jgi:hypothetical protein